MELEEVLILSVGLGSLVLGLVNFFYFKKGWGIKLNLIAAPYYAWVKPFASKSEKINLLIETIVLLVAGLGLLVLFWLTWALVL